MNYFDHASAAERYQKGRPYFHPHVIRMIRKHLLMRERLPLALDAGCGTGLSTLALTEIARKVIGVDPSAEMIALAPRVPGIDYLMAPAEKLPLSARVIDLITVSSAFHWLNRGRFFAEARRVLRPQGGLAVYSHAFSGKMEENAAFESWVRESYRSRYPRTPRSPVNFSPESAQAEGFELLGQEEIRSSIKFSAPALIDYLVTHSNVIAAVEGGDEPIEDARRWLTEEITPFFGERAEATFLFRGPIWYMRKL